MNLDLPAIDPAAPRPEFSAATACKQWLKALPLTNVQTVQGELKQQLELLSHYSLSALERLKILEQLRETVAYTVGELGKKYRNKPLPFSSLEQTAWNNVESLWQLLAANYRLCLQANIEGNAEVTTFTALITQRAMSCLVVQMLEYAHAYRSAPSALWRQLHALYAFAEEREVAAKRIKDSLNREDGSNSCEGVYAKALLLGLADPQQLSSRQLLQLDRWLDKWTARAPLSKEQPPTPTLPLVAVDLAGASGPAIYTGQMMEEKRFLDTERTAMSLRKRIKFLHGGGNTAEIGLGEDCIQPGCEAFLTALYRRWCEIQPSRAHNRDQVESAVQLCFAFPAIHFFLNDATPFKQPGETLDLAPEIMEDMRMYGRVTKRTEKLLVARLGYTLENWRCLDQSAGGFRLSRNGEGERISQNLLLALRPEASEHFTLAVVRWLVMNEDGSLGIGTRALPGFPTPLAARQITLNPKDAGPFVPAFQLSAVPEQKEPASLVLPIGWFQPGKRIQIYGSQMEEAKLIGLLEKGANFERVTFVSEVLY
ncbi:MAG: hypothetical protein Q8O38_04250 [Sulfurimicrobium sp.]|nr:hypothetical protein [Sulfurimicrobium sp.]